MKQKELRKLKKTELLEMMIALRNELIGCRQNGMHCKNS